MSYFCKNCGAVVTGKYCSCCGTKATRDYEDYCRERNDLSRKLRKMAKQYFKDTNDSVVSQFAMNVAIAKASWDAGVHPLHGEDTFLENPDARYAELEKAKAESVDLHIKIMQAIGYTMDELIGEGVHK